MVQEKYINYMKTGHPSKLESQKAKKKASETVFQSQIGRSDRVRTCGLNIPNVARYQLRHTPKYEI